MLAAIDADAILASVPHDKKQRRSKPYLDASRSSLHGAAMGEVSNGFASALPMLQGADACSALHTASMAAVKMA